MDPNSTPPPAGATPVAGTLGATPISTPPAGATPAVSLEDAQKLLAERDRQLTNHTEELERLRKFKAGAEKAQADADAAKLDDVQKAAKRADDAEKLVATYRTQLAEQEIRIAALKMKFRDPADAIGQLGGKLEIDEATGMPKDVEKHLKALADAKPYLLEGDPPRVPLSAGSASNPPRTSAPGTFTRESIQAMTPAERIAKLPEIKDWLSKQR